MRFELLAEEEGRGQGAAMQFLILEKPRQVTAMENVDRLGKLLAMLGPDHLAVAGQVDDADGFGSAGSG